MVGLIMFVMVMMSVIMVVIMVMISVTSDIWCGDNNDDLGDG
jgi:uncharacterized membrane protein